MIFVLLLFAFELDLYGRVLLGGSFLDRFQQRLLLPDKLLFMSRAKPTAHEPNCSYTLEEPELLHMSQTTEAFDLAKLLQTFDFDYHSYSKLRYLDHSNLVLAIATCTIGVSSFPSSA